MSRPAKLLKELLLKQIKGKMLFTTSTNVQFQREFCTDGIVLGSLGQVLHAGPLADVIQWANENLESSDTLESEDDSFDLNINFSNSEAADDDIVDFQERRRS